MEIRDQLLEILKDTPANDFGSPIVNSIISIVEDEKEKVRQDLKEQIDNLESDVEFYRTKT